MRYVVSCSVVLAGSVACGSWQRVGTDDSQPRPGTTVPRLFDATSVYRSMGALVGGGALPFIASVRYLAGPTTDSTLALFSVSLSNQTLSFQRHGNDFVAQYHVEASFRTDSNSVTPVRQIGSDQQVRVRNFQETLRADESVIYQQFVMVPPGVYQVMVMLRDRNSPAVSRAERVDTAPRFDASVPGMTKPLPVYTAEGRPQRADHFGLVANPRSTLPYGSDSMRFYLERYGAPPQSLLARVVDGTDRELWRDSVRLTVGADLSFVVITVPPGNLPVGQAELQTIAASGDTTKSRFLVSFSNQWVFTNFDEMVGLLRYYDRQDWVDSLRRSSPESRGDVWRDFWKSTDPVPITPENEALDDYFRRVTQANVRFADEGQPGWLTERGEVFISLGEPDEMLDMSSGLDRQNQRVIRWTYTNQRLVLYFQDQSGFGQFRLTPSSRSEFQRVQARLRRAGR